MSHWDSENQKIIHWPSEDSDIYPGWEKIDCGCCAGIQWGGEHPRECNTCKGNGIIYHHKKSGVLALYPGGPFCGKLANHLQDNGLNHIREINIDEYEIE